MGSLWGTLTYLSPSLPAESDWPQKAALAFRYSWSPTRSSWKVSSDDFTSPEPPSDFSRMSRVKDLPPLTSVPDRCTASASVAAAFAFASILSAVSLPTPLVPSSGSSPQPVPVTARPAHNAPTRAARRSRAAGK